MTIERILRTIKLTIKNILLVITAILAHIVGYYKSSLSGALDAAIIFYWKDALSKTLPPDLLNLFILGITVFGIVAIIIEYKKKEKQILRFIRWIKTAMDSW